MSAVILSSLCTAVYLQMKEYVDDTEDYINIMMDDKQNHLLQMNVLLTASCLVISVFIVVTGVFGMNIDISIYKSSTDHNFWGVVGGSGAGSLIMYVLLIGWCKWKNLI